MNSLLVKKTNVPIGFPILLNNRDFVRKELMKSAFFCPIHWDFSQIPELRQFHESYEISKKTLTIPINENVNISILNDLCKYTAFLKTFFFKFVSLNYKTYEYYNQRYRDYKG